MARVLSSLAVVKWLSSTGLLARSVSKSLSLLATPIAPDYLVGKSSRLAGGKSRVVPVRSRPWSRASGFASLICLVDRSLHARGLLESRYEASGGFMAQTVYNFTKLKKLTYAFCFASAVA